MHKYTKSHIKTDRRQYLKEILYRMISVFLSLNKGNISILALLDFSSAFDTIDHTILVHRLHTDFGFTDTVILSLL